MSTHVRSSIYFCREKCEWTFTEMWAIRQGDLCNVLPVKQTVLITIHTSKLITGVNTGNYHLVDHDSFIYFRQM